MTYLDAKRALEVEIARGQRDGSLTQAMRVSAARKAMRVAAEAERLRAVAAWASLHPAT